MSTRTYREFTLFESASGYAITKNSKLPIAITDVCSDSNITKYKIFGQLSQNSRLYKEYTYTCSGNETGNYYFIINGVNYYFTMPSNITNKSKILFDGYDNKLYLQTDTLAQLTVSSSQLSNAKNITMNAVQTDSPNIRHKEEILGVGQSGDNGYTLPILVYKNYATYKYDYNNNFKQPQTIYDAENKRVTVVIPEGEPNVGLSINLNNQLLDFNVGDTLELRLKLCEYILNKPSDGDNINVRIYNFTKGDYVLIRYFYAPNNNSEIVLTTTLTADKYTVGDRLDIYVWTDHPITFTVGDIIVTKPSDTKLINLALGEGMLYGKEGVYDEYDARTKQVTRRFSRSDVSVTNAMPNTRYFSNIKQNCFSNGSGKINVSSGEIIVYLTNSPVIENVTPVPIPLSRGNNFLCSYQGLNTDVEIKYQSNERGS